MQTEWFIGTITDDPQDGGKGQPTFDLTVPITEKEHRELREAERVIREALSGVLFRLVFANHRALKAQEARMLELLTRPDRRGFGWVPEQHLQTILALANWLTSFRWLLEHTKTRLAHEPDKLKKFKDATSQEFDGNFAYRFTYNLRDYSTHCDFPPMSMHVESRVVGANDRVDSLGIGLEPGPLLNASFDWKARVRSDLIARSEPIDLVPLIDEAMVCIERVMKTIIAVDTPDRREAARVIADGVNRLPDDAHESGAAPMLFAAEIEGANVKSISPTPLPITEARDILNSPECR
jgi:hypothetical protein